MHICWVCLLRLCLTAVRLILTSVKVSLTAVKVHLTAVTLSHGICTLVEFFFICLLCTTCTLFGLVGVFDVSLKRLSVVKKVLPGARGDWVGDFNARCLVVVFEVFKGIPVPFNFVRL